MPPPADYIPLSSSSDPNSQPGPPRPPMSSLPLPFNLQLPSLRALSLRHILALGAAFFVLLHVIASFHSETYGNATSLSAIKQSVGFRVGDRVKSWEKERAGASVGVDGEERRANAAFVILARNSDLVDTLHSIRQVEDRFNHKYNYPYIFLNELEFTQEFKDHTTALASGKTSYGLVPREHWDEIPDYIDMDKANKLMQEMGQKPIPYGGSLPYRKMCRYQSGFFWRHPLLDDLQFYWRVEPGIKFHCDINYDPFLFMLDNKKKYSFTVSIHEYVDTVKTLWDTTKDFLNSGGDVFLAENNLMKWVSNDKGETYNLCHFWSNFEIVDLSLWRSDAYRKYFDWLDKAGGFFYERWGDAPVHSIAAALFLNRDEIHFFDDIGYFHNPFHHCPVHADKTPKLECSCDAKEINNFEFHGYGCTNEFKALTRWKHPETVSHRREVFGMLH